MPGILTKLTISIFAKQKKDVSTLVLKQTVVVYLSLEGQWCKNKLSFLHNIISWNAKIKKNTVLRRFLPGKSTMFGLRFFDDIFISSKQNSFYNKIQT